MEVTRELVREINSKVKDFMNGLESQYGIQVDKVSCTYDNASFKSSFTCSLVQGKRDAGVLTADERVYDYNQVVFGLPVRGTIVTDGYGEEFQIKGWIPKGKKYQISILKLSNGKAHKASVDQIKGMARG
jgi:hypothetical protein